MTQLVWRKVMHIHELIPFLIQEGFSYDSIKQSLVIVLECAMIDAIDYFGNSSVLDLVKDAIFYYLLYGFLVSLYNNIRGYGIIGYPKIVFRSASKTIMSKILNSRLLKSKVEKEVEDTIEKIESQLIIETPQVPDFQIVPQTHLSDSQILEHLDNLSDLKHSEWESGKVSGAVYHGGDDLIALQAQAFQKFCVANQLHPDVFPGVRKMESEIVSMVLNMFNGSAAKEACGSTTSGGTESLMLACLAAKVYGEKYKGITKPEMVIPETAHAGFDKAGYYFGIKIHHARLDPNTYKVDLSHVKSLINSNTVLLAGSAPNFPHGIVDDIEGLSKLALRYDIRLHVDCCLGSFVIAYMSKAGFDGVLPPFDFRVPGVTSISCDTHKYGFAPKGSSVIMYRDSKLRECQYYVNTDWVGGLYGSPTFAGSRPGALSVGCWATMLSMGEDGYIESCRGIITNARYLKQRIQDEIPELRIIGDPLLSVVAFKSDQLDIYGLSDLLSKKGWHLSTLQKPAALHLALTRLSTPESIDSLVDCLKETVAVLASHGHAATKSDTSALYGVAGSVQTTGVADRLITGFIDTLYKVRE
ncbi:hypothetical protein WICPIJ_006224 [Wickerhamomyces pijperi]|uniref:sphinganine-1-phosphate aldolase n=1 Tax=Wickerhamomyces pijperi TaxID=599730 RepID=A0A9P8Q4B3_WICPI|nr:hypothetical protein WICPIJ_006224 [Wickerhamomyces pijperi]